MSDFNLPDNVTAEQVDAAHGEPDGRICATCRHCIEECCDYGMCVLNTTRSPLGFCDWYALMAYVESCRVDMQEDGCSEWEEC